MKYVFLAYEDDGRWNEMSGREREALEMACLASERELRQSGRLLAVEGIQGGRSAVTVRVVNGKTALAEGPQHEATGQLTRLFFIHARDLNDAIQVAVKMPQARRGPIEVRPVTQ